MIIDLENATIVHLLIPTFALCFSKLVDDVWRLITIRNSGGLPDTTKFASTSELAQLIYTFSSDDVTRKTRTNRDNAK